MQRVTGKVAVIGAGPGGLASAMVLASKGLDVTVYEKADRVGGRCSHLNVEGVKFDVGPTFLMMKFVLEEVFRQSGKNANNYMKNIQIEPMYRLDFNKNKKLDAFSQDKKELMFEQFSKTFPEDSKNFNYWIQRETERYKKLIPLLQTPFLGYQSFLSLDAVKALPHLALGQSVSSILSKDFKNPLSQLSFAFQTKYLGMSPVEAPGFYNIVAFVEHMFGVYHTEGGLNSMNTGMAKAAQELGAKILLNTPVKEFVLKGKDIKGVKLANGQVEEYDKVVLNGDFMTSMEQLVPDAEQVLGRWKPSNLAKKRYSCSTFMLYIALDKVYTHHPHHSILFCDDVPKNLKEIADGIIPDTPSIYLQNASVTDPTLAPQGKSGLYVLVPVPNLVAQTEAKAKEFWENPKHVAEYRSKVLNIIKERCNMPDLEQHIIGEKMITPVQWKEQRGIYGGAVFSLAHNLTQMLVFRPRNRFEELNNLYLVGAGTNPGSGLPTIFESSLITSELICKEYGIPMERVQYNTLNNWK